MGRGERGEDGRRGAVGPGVPGAPGAPGAAGGGSAGWDMLLPKWRCECWIRMDGWEINGVGLGDGETRRNDHFG
jgi:hypothetical protein